MPMPAHGMPLWPLAVETDRPTLSSRVVTSNSGPPLLFIGSVEAGNNGRSSSPYIFMSLVKHKTLLWNDGRSRGED